MSRFSQSEIREAVSEMSTDFVAVVSNTNDPTNAAARIAAAQKENADWHREHPTGWAATARRGIQAERTIRHEEIRRGKPFASEQEKDAYLRSL